MTRHVEYIEGKRPVVEALRSHVPIESVLISDNVKRDGLMTDLMRKARQRDIPVKTISRKKLDELSESGNHQGVIAVGEPFTYVRIADMLRSAEADHPSASLIVVLDHITDAGNLGAIARSAESVGATGLIIPNKRTAQVTAATYKGSAGAIAYLPVAQVSNLPSALDRLKEEGYWVAACTEQTDELIWDANLSGKIVLVMGNEHEGISRLMLEHCDFRVKLPQMGAISSLNVAQAATACMYEWLRQNR